MSFHSKRSKKKSGSSFSSSGRTVSKADTQNSIAHKKTYGADGRVEDDVNAEAYIKIAMRAKAARRAEVVGMSGQPTTPASIQTRALKVPRIEKNEESYNLIKNALEKNILFNDCTHDQINMVIYAMRPKKIAKDTKLINEGDEGYNFYVVQKGRFEFSKGSQKLGEANGGDSFGELALLFYAPRAATVTALTPAEVWKLDRVTFRQILDSSNSVKAKRMRDTLRNCTLFADFDDEKIEQLVDIGHFQSFRKGDVVIRKGDDGSFFYIISAGAVQVTKAGERDDLNDTIYGPGDYFGERSLLTNEPRAANVIAIEDTDTVVLDKNAFDKHLGSLVETLDHNLGMRVLQSVDLLSELDHEQYQELVDELNHEMFKAGQMIIKEGDIGKKFYIIKSGKVEIVKDQVGDELERTVVATLGNGGYFGEMALLSSDPRQASVYALTDCALFTLDRDTFERMFGPLNALKKKVEARKSELRASEISRGSKTSEMMGFSPEEVIKESIKFEDLIVKSTLGTGTFGRVKLVQHKKDGATYALKILQKYQIVQYKQQNNVMNEKKVMKQSDHPFILRLYETYRDQRCLYMLLELVQGGELFTLLHGTANGKLPNQQARFYAGCVLDALHYLHRKHICYRDLKPENLMIDTSGYIRVVDFGFAKVVKTKTYTLCGTPEYLAVELVLQKGHNRAVDYWALGVLIFEMLHGVSPFADLRRNEQITICRNIVRLRFDFPKAFPSSARSLVSKLLKRYPHERLGMQKAGAQDIKDHRWFNEMDWEKLVNKDLQAPWLPSVSSNLDTSNFDNYEEELDTHEYKDDGSNWDAKF